MIPILIILAGIIISAWLGLLGVFNGELQFSKNKTLQGKAARFAGVLCLCFSALLGGLCIWVALDGLKP